MTVSELIEILEGLPGEALVLGIEWDERVGEHEDVEISSVEERSDGTVLIY